MSHPIEEKLQPLRRRIGGLWMIGWTVCVLSLGILAVVLKRNLDSQDLDSQLSIYATATYGLSWFDANGNFHGELLAQDTEITDSPFDIWVVEPGTQMTVHWQSPHMHYAQPDLRSLAQQALSVEPSFSDAARTLPQHNLRLQTALVYQDGNSDTPRAAVLVLGSNQKSSLLADAFVLRLGAYCILLLALGFGLGNALSRRSLAPVVQALEERERFLSAAAHEIRTPLSTLSVLAESNASDVLPRIQRLAGNTAKVVDQLLLFAQLDSGTTKLQRQPLRLDLMAEALVPENLKFEIRGGEIEVNVDEGLFRILFDNLMRNAECHGEATQKTVVLELAPNRIVMQDQGPGFPERVFEKIADGATFVSSQGGVGLGLTLLRMIVELHGGKISLQNTPEGGARIEILNFAPRLR